MVTNFIESSDPLGQQIYLAEPVPFLQMLPTHLPVGRMDQATLYGEGSIL